MKSNEAAGKGPFEGLRVLDFSWVWSGPLVTSILAELGAEVIKIEHGKRLDNSRLRGKSLRDGKEIAGPSIETGPYFHQTNHDRLSITLDLKSAAGRPLLDKLVAKSDILVENLSPGALARSGAGYERLSTINPQLIYLSMSAVGQDGPLASMKAYAPIMSSFCGLENLVGYPGQPPVGMMNFGLGDPNAAVHGLVALLSAVYARQRGGKGQHIDLSQIEALLSVMPVPLIGNLLNRTPASTTGNRHPFMAPHGIFSTSVDDQWVSIAVNGDTQWQALVDAMGHPAWAMTESMDETGGRLTRQDELEQHLSAWTRTLSRDELVPMLRGRGIACSPVLNLREQWVEPNFVARGLRQNAHHDVTGDELLYRAPWLAERNSPRVSKNAPLLGKSNEYVFSEVLGLDTEEVSRLVEAGVIA